MSVKKGESVYFSLLFGIGDATDNAVSDFTRQEKPAKLAKKASKGKVCMLRLHNTPLGKSELSCPSNVVLGWRTLDLKAILVGNR